MILILLLLFQVTSNLIILRNDNTPLLWDGGDYFYRSLKYYDVFANISSNFFTEFNKVSPYRPPLFLLTSLPLYLLLGRSTDVAAMTNLIYLVILVLSVYGIGRRIHSKTVGLLAGFVVTTFPILFGLSRSYWLDFPLTAMVSLSMYLLIRADYFRERKYSILFGVSAGLGMLTKWTYFVFLIGPFVYFLIIAYRGNREEREKSIKPALNALVSVIIGMAVASFWYIPNGWSVATKLFGLSVGITGEEATRFQQLGETIGPSGIFTVKSLIFYAGRLVNDQISFFYAIVFLIFMILLLTKKDRRKIWLFLIWIAVPVIAFTLIKNKTSRNTVPMLPAIALIISFGIIKIKSSRVKILVSALVLFIGFFQYMASSYGSSLLPKKLALKTSIGNPVFFQQHDNTSHTLYRASVKDWKAEEILDTINAGRGEKPEVTIVLIPRDAFTWMAMEYTGYLKGMPFIFIGAVDFPEAVINADYILIKKGGFVAPWFSVQNIHHSLDIMEDNMEDFTLLESVMLPDEAAFLAIYDKKATRKSRKSGVVFSGKLEILDYSVSISPSDTGSDVTVALTMKSIREISGEYTIVFNLLNKRLEGIMREMVKSRLSISGLEKGKTKSIEASLRIPREIEEDFFSLEVGFYESSKKEYLTFRPEYLIYERKTALSK